jgi:hypothetical protein
MIRYDAIGQQADWVFLHGLDQNAFEGFEVAILLKKRQARDGPIEGMIDKTTWSDSRLAGHGAMLFGRRLIVK